jgi:beta-galactosidase
LTQGKLTFLPRAKTLETGPLELPILHAGQTAEIPLPTDLFQHKVHPAYLTITVEQRGKVEWDQGAFVVAWTQQLVSKPTEKIPVSLSSLELDS